MAVNTHSFSLRRADSSDAVSISRFLIDKFCGSYEGTGILGKASPVRVWNGVVDILENGAAWIIEDEHGEIRGSMGGSERSDWYTDETTFQDQWLFVEPGYRGARCATDLIDAFVDHAKSIGKPAVLGIICSDDLDRKERYFKRLGFDKTGARFIKS